VSLRTIVAVLLVVIGALALYAWSRNTATAPSAPDATGSPAPGGSSPELVVESGGDPGIEWTVPPRWSTESGSPVRLATYAIPAASGDAEGARCAVYYFGPDQGGGTTDNIERWIGEFEKPNQPERSSKTVDGLPITIVRVRGTYLAHASMGQSTGTRARHQLYGAIVEGPQGSVFFKLVGPGKTVDLAAGEFEKMLASVCKKTS
jgi:hypothetical protein